MLSAKDAKDANKTAAGLRWNTLSLFAVPAGHAVSLVAPWAAQDRLAVTGWLLL